MQIKQNSLGLSAFIAASLLALGLDTSQAAIIFTLPTATTAGSIVVTNDIAFTVTTADNVRLVAFDEWVTNDGNQTFFAAASISPALSYSLNAADPTTVAWSGLSDNLATTTTGDLTPNDGYFAFRNVSVAPGDVFTLKAATYTLAAGSLPAGFNPQAAQTFTGNAFLANILGGRRSANTPVVAVPEPTSALLLGLGALGLVARRRRA